MKRRIFVALPIEGPLQNEVLEWEDQFKKFSVRWLEGKNLHITLVPPWYTDDVESVIEELKSVEDTIGSFDISFFKVVYGPTPREPRLIWTEGETSPKLIALKEALEKAINTETEKRHYKLHCTLARFRPETFSSFSIKHLDEKVSWTQRCGSFVLMESHLSRSGADYEILESFTI